MTDAQLEAKVMQLPFICDWVKYKGEVYFAGVNWERSLSANRVMIDLSFCATAYLAGDDGPIVEKTVTYHPLKFSKHKFT